MHFLQFGSYFLIGKYVDISGSITHNTSVSRGVQRERAHPMGLGQKTVKSACFGLIFVKFHHSAPRSTLWAWNPAYASA